MLNKYEYVIKTSDQVEQILISRHPHIACYSFADKLSRLNGSYPYSIQRHLHTIRQQRNFIAHNQEFNFNWNAYDTALVSIHNWFGTTIAYQPPCEVRQVSVTRITEVQKESNPIDSKKILQAAGAGLAVVGLASLLGNSGKDKYRF